MRNMNTQKPLKSKVSITLDEEDRNFSQYINLVLKKHIESERLASQPKD